MIAGLLAAFFVAAFHMAEVRSQSTWIVDDSGGGHFTDLPAAVAAAAEGDTLLVRPGHYSATEVGKGLAVLGDNYAVVHGTSILPSLRLSVQSGATCVIADLHCPDGVFAHDCPGLVHLEDLSADSLVGSLGWPALGATNCGYLSIHDCRFRGEDFWFLGERAAPAAYLAGCNALWALASAYGNDSMVLHEESSHAVLGFDSRLAFVDPRLYGGKGATYYYYVYPNPIPIIDEIISNKNALLAIKCHVRIAGRSSLGFKPGRGGADPVHSIHANDSEVLAGPITGMPSITGSASLYYQSTDVVLATLEPDEVQFEILATPPCEAELFVLDPATLSETRGPIGRPSRRANRIASASMDDSSWTVRWHLPLPSPFDPDFPLAVVRARITRGNVVTDSLPAVFLVR